MTATVPQEEVRQYVNDQIEEVIQEALRIKLDEELAENVDAVVQGVHSKLNDQDVNIDRENAKVERIATKHVLDAMYGSDTSEEGTSEIAVGGRSNEGVSTKTALNDEYEIPTKTKEVPIEGGDVDNPDTIEIQVPDPDLSQARWNEALTPEQEQYIWEERYSNDREEFDPESVPKGGFPWYQ